MRRSCAELGAPFAVSDVHERGGEGGTDLADVVMAHAEKSSRPFCPLYDWSEPIKTKLELIARKMYGARKVAYSHEANRDLKLIEKLEYGGLPPAPIRCQNFGASRGS